LGEIHRQHAAVIGAGVREDEWKGKMQSENLQEQFLEYLKTSSITLTAIKRSRASW
jgi:hypothetical protein